MSKLKLRKHELIGVIASILLAVLTFYFIFLSGPVTLPSRLTTSIKSHVTHPDIFTPQKLISTHEEGALNGDTLLEGKYRTSTYEMQQLWDSKNLLFCSPHSECQIDKPETDDVIRCVSGVESKDIILRVCLDKDRNEVDWSYAIT